MDFRDTLSALLPEPRDDEPASLRQDILDELRDHLACAYNRELLRGAAPDVARERVLDQFGNPAAVARRLWFDAMKGKIMAQRVLIATCVIVTLAFGASVGLAWSWMNQDRLMRSRETAALIDGSRRMVDALAQTQSVNQELLKEIRALSESSRAARRSDGSPVAFKLNEESAGGPPAVGFLVELGPAENSRAKPVVRVSDASGTVEFGPREPGDYEFTITDNGADGLRSSHGRLNVAPGIPVVKYVVCPKIPPERVNIRLQLPCPADLANEDFLLYVSLLSRDPTVEGGWKWDRFCYRTLLYGFGAQHAYLLEVRGNRSNWNLRPGAPFGLEIQATDLQEVGAAEGSVAWSMGTYHLQQIAILRRTPAPPDRADKRWFAVLATSQAPSILPMEGRSIRIPDAFWGGKSATFVAERSSHTWMIVFPDELIEAARAALHADRAPKKKTAGPAMLTDGK